MASPILNTGYCGRCSLDLDVIFSNHVYLGKGTALTGNDVKPETKFGANFGSGNKCRLPRSYIITGNTSGVKDRGSSLVGGSKFRTPGGLSHHQICARNGTRAQQAGNRRSEEILAKTCSGPNSAFDHCSMIPNPNLSHFSSFFFIDMLIQLYIDVPSMFESLKGSLIYLYVDFDISGSPPLPLFFNI